MTILGYKYKSVNRSLILLCLSVLIFSSCFKDNHGYPEKIVFDRSGGKLTITGAYPPYHISIVDYNGDGTAVPPGHKEGTIILTEKWLTVSNTTGASSLDVVAESNDTGKRRKLRIMLAIFNDRPEIFVIQKK